MLKLPKWQEIKEPKDPKLTNYRNNTIHTYIIRERNSHFFNISQKNSQIIRERNVIFKKKLINSYSH